MRCKIAFNFSSVKVGGGKNYYLRFLQFLKSHQFYENFGDIDFYIFTFSNDHTGFPKNIHFIKGQRSSFFSRLIFENIYIPLYCARKKITTLVCPADLLPVFAGTKTVALIRNANLYLSEPYADTFLSNMRVKILRILSKRTLRKSDLLIFVSQSICDMANKVVTVSRDRTTIIPHGVDPFPKQNIPENEIHKIQQTYGKFLVSVSSVYYFKNFEDIIRALTLIPEDKVSKLLIVGKVIEEKYYQYLRSLTLDLALEDRVVFIDEVSNPYLYYRASLCCVCASRLESFGNTAFEALSTQTPVILSDIPVFKEFFSPLQEKGRIDFYQCGNLVDLKNKILDTLEQDKGRSNGALQFHTWDQCFQKMLRAVSKV